MSTQPTQDLDRAPMEAGAVADYLRRHPDFFLAYPGLLAELVIPHHDSGEAVSLVERQVTLLREHNQQLKQQLQTLIHNARTNEALSERMHKLTLSLLDCDSTDGLFAALCDTLHEEFSADEVVVCLTGEDAPVPAAAPPRRTVAVRRLTPPDLQLFADLLKDGQAVCGRLTHRQCAYLFGEQAADITSVALAPLRAEPEGDGKEPLTGLLAIGSRDTQRFQSGMGTVFLNQLADIVTAKLVQTRR